MKLNVALGEVMDAPKFVGLQEVFWRIATARSRPATDSRRTHAPLWIRQRVPIADMRVSRRDEFQPDRKWRGCTANEI